MASAPIDRRIRNEGVRRLQKRLAIPTIILPNAGMIVCIVQIFTRGVGWMEIGLLAGGYLLTMTGISVGFHRYLAHRSFLARRPLRAIFAILGSMGGQGPVINWVSNHRRHHAHSDQVGDPHSPHLTDAGVAISGFAGFWHAHIGWMLGGDVTNAARFSKDLLRDPMIVLINRLQPLWIALSLAVPAAIGWSIRGTGDGALQGLLWGGLFPVAVTQQCTWSIASLAHIFGTRPFETTRNDTSRNNLLIALPILGDGWHNNHHAFPSVAICGFEWWQIDPSGWIISALAPLGWVYQVNGVPSRAERDARRRGARRAGGVAAATTSEHLDPALGGDL
jgi:stearoyl-CoA desaturase (delta-9 desaturase)